MLFRSGLDVAVAADHDDGGAIGADAFLDAVEDLHTVDAGEPDVEEDAFEGLLVDYVERTGAHAIIRGLRAISDFEHEFQMALINRKLAKHVETVFLMPSEEFSYLSSTIIKDVAHHGGCLTEFLHPEVARRLQERIWRDRKSTRLNSSHT